jgi:hypothetical protein
MSRRDFKMFDLGGVAGRDGAVYHPLRFRSFLAALVPPSLGTQSRDSMTDVLAVVVRLCALAYKGNRGTF